MLHVKPLNSAFQFAEDMEIIQAFCDWKPNEFEPARVSGWHMVNPHTCSKELKAFLPLIRERLEKQAAQRNK